MNRVAGIAARMTFATQAPEVPESPVSWFATNPEPESEEQRPSILHT